MPEQTVYMFVYFDDVNKTVVQAIQYHLLSDDTSINAQ